MTISKIDIINIIRNKTDKNNINKCPILKEFYPYNNNKSKNSNKYKRLFDYLIDTTIRKYGIDKKKIDDIFSKNMNNILNINNEDEIKYFDEFLILLYENIMNFRTAVHLCEKCYDKYGIRSSNLMQDLFSTDICIKDKKPLLIYHQGSINEKIIIKDNNNNKIISFITDLLYKDDECNYYSNDDYIKMDNIEKYYDEVRIMNALNQSVLDIIGDKRLNITDLKLKIKPHGFITCKYGV